MTIPPIHVTDDWKAWAKKLSNYLRQQLDPGGQEALPRPILLAHTTSDAGNIGVERALEGGVLLYDPVNEVPIYADGTQWLMLVPVDWIVSNMQVASYNSGNRITSVAGANITNTFAAFIDLVNLTISSPKHITITLADDTFQSDYAGVFEVGFSFFMNCAADAAADRILQIRLYNVADAVAGAVVAHAVIPQNETWVSADLTFLWRLAVADVNKKFRLEIATTAVGKTVTSVSWVLQSLEIRGTSEWDGFPVLLPQR